MDEKEESVGEDMPGPNPNLSDVGVPTPGQPSPNLASPAAPNTASTTALPASSPSQPLFTEISPRPSVLTLPVSTSREKKGSSKGSSNTKVLPSSDEDDLFGSNSLFGATSATKETTPSSRNIAKTAQDQASSGALKKDKEKSTVPSIFDDHGDDLFQRVQPKSATKKAKASSFMEEDNDDEEDIFGVSNSSTPTSTASKDTKSSSSLSKQDIFQVLCLSHLYEQCRQGCLFQQANTSVLAKYLKYTSWFLSLAEFLFSQDEVAAVPKVHKRHKEKTIDASLFDDNIDIFADLTTTSRPKEKSKKKGETKSIFDDDMGKRFTKLHLQISFFALCIVWLGKNWYLLNLSLYNRQFCPRFSSLKMISSHQAQ